MTARICLIRHGETDWNVARRIQGHTDIPLNHTGQEQARLLAQSLADERFDAIYASDLSRARQTAEAVAHRLHMSVRLDPHWRERHYGSFQALTYDEARERYPDAYARFEARVPDADFPGGGESLHVFLERVRKALDRIADAHPGGRVLVATHGGVLDMAHRVATDLPLEKRRDFPISNATVNWLMREDGDWRILVWDERSHLDQALDELP
ncbi:histidine phosphatase family protein [Niveibacterium umoris]|uniref:Putative phosphoglycerate mutase n=1 Tax=Niveibacterium umoris TaxID=1193620 RepID=A0A840BM36_9RHOO|nr:histidine phosphatase family protein [Niveibacterium umoris]MBB4014611.1 putative phosphoglycerate mutase [Niveibacterium umoris]